MQGQNPSFKPQKYEDWLSELTFSTKAEDMVKAAIMAIKMNPDKKAVKHDLAVVLASMYQSQMKIAAEKPLAIRVIEEKFETVTRTLFKSSFKSLLNYVRKTEPSFDPSATAQAQGRSSLGYINASTTEDKEGNVRAPLGFVKKPKPRKDEKGNSMPGLGYLQDEGGGGTNSSLGFL